MKVSEPVTLITDYMLGALGCAFAWRLYRAYAEGQQSAVGLWALAMAAMAAAAVFGGTHHGFASQLGPALHTALWKGTVYAAGVAAMAMAGAAVFATVSPPARLWLLALAAAQFAVYAAWMIGHDEFAWVIADYGSAMLAVLALEIWRRTDPGAAWIIAGVVVSAAGAGVQLSRVALHRHFNHNDLYHVIQMAALWLFYRGALLLRDR